MGLGTEWKNWQDSYRSYSNTIHPMLSEQWRHGTAMTRQRNIGTYGKPLIGYMKTERDAYGRAIGAVATNGNDGLSDYRARVEPFNTYTRIRYGYDFR